MKRYVVLVAGGSGSRMKSEIPKQFLSFNGKPVLIHTIERFYYFDKTIGIILVLPEEAKAYWKELTDQNMIPCPVLLAPGGATRSASTRSGLKLVPDDCIVAVHDAVRPLLSQDLISRCYIAAEKYGNACPYISPIDSLRMKDGETTISVDRSNYFQVQTPQCFRAELLKAAFQKFDNAIFTDEASAFEHAGNSIHLIEGERWNIKITYPEDLLVAEALSSRL